MHKSEKVLTFEEFRHSHEDILRRQRETLENEAVAEAVLAEGAARPGWVQWPDGYYVTAS